MSDTTHLQLPLLAAAQASKHVTHNDALLRLDALVQLSVKDRDLTSPPGSPADGDRYIPASGSTGDWSGWDLNVAWFVDGVWTKLVPREGWMAYVGDEHVVLVHSGSAWSVLGADKLAKAANLSDLASARDAAANLGTWHVLAASAAGWSHTGNTNETALATVTVPGGAMGANGILRIHTVWSGSGGSSSKVARVRFGGAGGTAYYARGMTTQASDMVRTSIANRNSESSQVGGPTAGSGGWGQSSASPQTSSKDTSADVDIALTGALNDGGDTITLESYLVELFHQA